MQNQSESDFKSKFHLLNSQENSEDIIWSCSDSSDYENENTNTNQSLRQPDLPINNKRKRTKEKKKTLKNISNLNITFLEEPSDHKGVKSRTPSPVLRNVIPSPILTKSRQNFAPINIKKSRSPILSRNNKKSSYIQAIKSPILILKHPSPKVSPNVRKKLFVNNNNTIDNLSLREENTRSKSPVLNCSPIHKKSKLMNTKYVNGAITNVDCCDIFNVHNIKQEILESDCTNQNDIMNSEENNEIQVKNEISIHEKDNILRTKSTNVKAYFDSHLSSETLSQQSISEYDTTPKNSSRTSEEIEIVNSQSEKVMPQIIKLENRSSSDSLRSYEFIEKSKKVKRKKGGLAYRLSVLLRKQKATTNLWQHERFLAANSNFVLPTDDFLPFHIQNVSFQYGCHLIELKDVNNLQYFAIINNFNMTSNNLEQCNVFKLYKPFKILDFNSDHRLIVNVSKFECEVLNSLKL